MTDTIDFSHRLVDLRADLERDLDVVRALAPLERVRRELDTLVEDLDRQSMRAKRAAVVVIVGPTGSGKSTLLNALVGGEIAKEGELRPTTSRPTVYAPKDADVSALVDDLDGPQPAVVRYDPASEGPFAGQVLVDAPDTNSAALEHRVTVRALAERADVLLVLLKAESVVEESTLAFLDDFKGRRELVLVLGRADELAPKSRDAVLSQMRVIAGERLGVEVAAPIAVSALDARRGRGGEPFRALVSRLEELADSGALMGVKRHNALGAAARIAELVESRTSDARVALEGLGPALERGLSDLANRTGAEVSARALLRAPELAERVAAEAGRRWNGPVGWTLRLGTFSTVGLGAAALVARRNPLLAAGAAVAGTLASRTKDLVVERRLEDAAALMPEPSEFEAMWLETLSDVRLAAGRLERGEGADVALEVPSAASLRESFERPVADAWLRVLARDLPEAAARTAHPAVKLLFDLLPYALIAWMVWSAARGFLSGAYVGLDFLLNGFFLLAALLLVLRLLLGARHGAIGRRLARTAATRATTTLTTTAARAAEPLTERTRTRAAALARIADLAPRWRSALAERNGPR